MKATLLSTSLQNRRAATGALLASLLLSVLPAEAQQQGPTPPRSSPNSLRKSDTRGPDRDPAPPTPETGELRMGIRAIDIPAELITYKNSDLLAKFTTETGKILPRRVTGVSAKMHRRITRAIKRARAVNILP